MNHSDRCRMISTYFDNNYNEKIRIYENKLHFFDEILLIISKSCFDWLQVFHTASIINKEEKWECVLTISQSVDSLFFSYSFICFCFARRLALDENKFVFFPINSNL